ncbi:MAG: helix-hairpin-helix domain-containing protein [Bacteroidota bacterium]
MRGIYLCIVLLAFGSVLHSQETEEIQHNSPDIESMMENSSDDGTGKSATLDQLEYYRTTPVNINAASFQELTEVPFLPACLAVKILFLRDSLGNLSLPDLRLIPGMDEQTLGRISPFVTFAAPKTRTKLPALGDSLSSLTIRSRGSVDLQPQKPFLDGEYSGSRVAEYHRLVINTPQWSGGVLYDKDAGEACDAGFVSGYIGFENEGIVKKFVAGDYTLNSGEGLTLSSFRSSSKGGNALYQIKATGRTIVPHLATDEFHYFQGAAATMDIYPLEVTLFFSRKAVAATLDSAGAITSFYTSGLFRSQTEMAKRNAANETVIGGIAACEIGRTNRVGLSAFETRYDKQVDIQSPFVYCGKSILAVGANADFVFDSFTLFGEAAGNSRDSQSGVAGLIYQVSKRLSLSSQVRSYSSRYANPYAYGFGEQNGVVNGESGHYLGMEYRVSNGIKISTSYDEFSLPSSGTFTNTGNEYIVRCEGAIAKSVTMLIQFKDNAKTEENVLNDGKPDQQKVLEVRNQENLRASCSFTLNKWTEFVQRVEMTTVSYSISHNQEDGVLMFTELNLSSPQSRFYGTTRMVFFETQSYDSRLYEYEGDVRGGYSFPPLYGKGSRWYIVAGCKVFPHVELSCKYSETFQTGAASIGTGNSEIIGPLDNRVTLQMDVRL